jgi:hypothetical protein
MSMSSRIVLASVTGLSAVLALTAGARVARGECLPHYKPAELALYSDLIVVATEQSRADLRIETVLEGTWKGERISVPGLGGFEKSRGAGEKAAAVTGKCVLFLRAAHGRAGVVFNGVYRVRADGAVLGYAQEHNPGGYMLQAEPAYPSLAALLQAVERGRVQAAKRRAELLRAAEAADSLDQFFAALDELQRVTRRGDAKVLAFLGKELARGGDRAEPCLRFLQNYHDPAVFPILKAHLEKTGDLSLLYTIARQGTPDAVPYLESLVRKGKDRERRTFALLALEALYGALEEADEGKMLIKLRYAIFDLYDTLPFARDCIAGHPRVLGVIPHPEAVKRLEQILARVRGDGTNREYEVERVLRECRARMMKRLGQ